MFCEIYVGVLWYFWGLDISGECWYNDALDNKTSAHLIDHKYHLYNTLIRQIQLNKLTSILNTFSYWLSFRHLIDSQLDDTYWEWFNQYIYIK
jgi:hypothetical protein